ncbi:microtubule-associated protein 70-5-like [Sesbania bispinosa]|nr:microtubule-associated protein 70-5-like [Sesbania bispinosa]
MLKKGIWASRSKVVDNGEKENEIQVNTYMNLNRFNDEREATKIKNTLDLDEESESYM